MIRQVSATHTIAAIAISAVLIVASQNVQAILPVDNRSPDPLRVTNSDFKDLFDTTALVDIVIVPSDRPEGAAGCSGYSVGQGLVLTAAHCLSAVVEEDPTKPAGQSATAGKIFGIRSPGSVWVSSGADNPRTVKAYDGSWLVTPNARTEAFGRGYAVEFHPVWDLALLRTTSETPSRFYGASVFLIPDLIMDPSDRAAVVEVNNLFSPFEPPVGFPSQEVFNFIPAFKAGYSYPGGVLTRTALISAAFISPTPRFINDGDFPWPIAYHYESAEMLNLLHGTFETYGNQLINVGTMEMMRALGQSYGHIIKADSGGPLFVSVVDSAGNVRYKLGGVVARNDHPVSGKLPESAFIRKDQSYTQLQPAYDWVTAAAGRLGQAPAAGETLAFAAPFRQLIQDDTLIQSINVDFGEASGTYIDALDAFVVYGTGLSGEIDKIAVSGIFEISGLAFFSEDNTALDIVASPLVDIMAIGFRPLLQSSLPPFEILSATGVFDSPDPVSYLSFATGLAGLDLEWLWNGGINWLKIGFLLSIRQDFSQGADIEGLAPANAFGGTITWATALPVPEPQIYAMYCMGGMLIGLAVRRRRLS